MLSGHHFPNVTLVGVVAADGSLNIGDFRAEERTFQIITQVAGRAGREKEKGSVIVQTYNPDNYAIICSKEHDYDKFYLGEISLRKRLNYPPFCDIILIRVHGNDLNNVQRAAEKIYSLLIKNKDDNLYIYKPVPSPIDKIQSVYRWRIVIKGRLNKKAVEIIENVLNEFHAEKNKDVSIVVDSNPNNMM